MEFVSSLQGGIDESKPSLFELLSEQQLARLLPPSLRYLLALATHRYPRYFLRILNSFDELYALLMLVVERHYLRIHGGGFTENFYGIKRERVLRIKGGEVHRAQSGAASIVRDTLKLRNVDVWKNLAVLVGLPYLKRKLDESYDIYAPQATLLGSNFNRHALPPNPSMSQRLLCYYKWFLRNVYPSVNAAYYFSLLAFNLAYLFDSSMYHSPFFWLIGTRMRRLGQADYQAIALATETPPLPRGRAARAGQANSILNPRIFGQTVYPRLLTSLKILLPTSIFALKFLEWWHASDFARQLSRKAAEGLDLPPPVTSDLPARSSNSSSSTTEHLSLVKTNSEENIKRPSTKPHYPVSKSTNLPILTVPPQPPATSGLCPICGTHIITATTSSFGYVFCYTCIHKWVEGMHHRQIAFMGGAGSEEAVWGENGGAGAGDHEGDDTVSGAGNRKGSWESGIGRCAVSGRRILGGTEGLRRVVA